MGSTLSTFASLENLSHAFSGAVASVVAISVFFPLETIRVRKQVDVRSLVRQSRHPLQNIFVAIFDVYHAEGVAGLYRGYIAVVSALCCSNFVYFYSLAALKRLIAPLRVDTSADRDAVLDLSTALIAGVVNVLITTPLWVVNTRLKLQGVRIEKKEEGVIGSGGTCGDHEPHVHSYNDKFNSRIRFDSSTRDRHMRPTSSRSKYYGVFHALRLIRREEGLAALYAGTLPSLLLVLNPALQWMCYEFLKRLALRRLTDGTKDLGSGVVFFISALAKLLSTVVTYPLQVVQTRMRFLGGGGVRSGESLLSTLKALWGEGGFYKGLDSKLAQTVMTAAFMFSVYEKTLAIILRRSLT